MTAVRDTRSPKNVPPVSSSPSRICEAGTRRNARVLTHHVTAVNIPATQGQNGGGRVFCAELNFQPRRVLRRGKGRKKINSLPLVTSCMMPGFATIAPQTPASVYLPFTDVRAHIPFPGCQVPKRGQLPSA